MMRRLFKLDPAKVITLTARVRSRLSRALSEVGLSQDWLLIPLAAVVGVLAGLVAMAFEWMVHASGAMFGRIGSLNTSTVFSLLLLIGLPALGGLAVGLIQVYISRAPAGHGIPDVILALRRRRGVMKGRTGVFKAITASLTIGSGGSAGVEGPIVHIGSVLGSVVGQTLKLNKDQMNTLVGCGAAAGLASIFNAPIAGVLFVLEVILRDFSVKTFTPIVIASVFGTALAQSMLGHNEALFMLPTGLSLYEFELGEIGHYAVLGVLCGLVGMIFTRLMTWSEQRWSALPLPRVFKPALGGALLGVLGVVFVLTLNHPVPTYQPPPFYANGYPVIEALFNPASYNLGDMATTSADGMPIAQVTLVFLLVALVFKMVGTMLTLGSGGSGGVFAPSLFMGATLGGAFGVALQQMGLLPGDSPATYALAGMAGMLAATVHCPLSAFLLVFELTRDYKVILPVMLVAIVSTTIAQLLFRHSTYTHVLAEMGFRFANYSDLAVLQRLTVDDVALTPAVVTRPTDPAQNLLKLAENPLVEDFVVCDVNDQYLGLVAGEDLRAALLGQEALPLLVVGDLLRTDPPVVGRDEALETVLDKFSQHDVASLPVVENAEQPGQVLGMISRTRLMRRYHQALDHT